MQVALEHAGPALQVMPQRFPAVVVRRGRSDQPRDHAGRHLAAVHVAAMQPVHVVIRRDIRRGLKPDDGTEALGVLVREIEHDTAADRAAHHHGLVELQRVGDLEDHPHVVARGELVLLVLVAFGRRGFPVPRHVEHDDAIVVGDALVVEQPAILPSVGARGVQAKQRNALARLLDVEPVRPSEQVEVEIAPDDELEAGAHWHSRPKDGVASLAYGLPARRGQHILDVKQVRHQRMQVALDRKLAALEQREDVVVAGWRHLGPEQLPLVAWRAQREAVIRRDERSRRDRDDAALDDLHQIALVADLHQERGAEIAPAPDEILVGVHKVGNPFDHRNVLPMRASPAHRRRRRLGPFVSRSAD